MRTFSSKSPIPAVAAAGRIDIRYGGQVAQVERESLEIAEAYVTTLENDRAVLYLNTLSNQIEMFYRIEAAYKRLRSEIRTERLKSLSLETDEIHDRREMILQHIMEHHVRVVILNSFDFASMTRRGRRRIFQFLKYLRDFMQMHIIVYTRHEPCGFMLGVYGDLAWLAASVSALDNPVLVAVKRTKQVPGQQTLVTETGVKTIDVVHEVEFMSVEAVENASGDQVESDQERGSDQTSGSDQRTAIGDQVAEGSVPVMVSSRLDERKRALPTQPSWPKQPLPELPLPKQQTLPKQPVTSTDPVWRVEKVDPEFLKLVPDEPEYVIREVPEDNNVLLAHNDLAGAKVTPPTPFPKWADQDYPDDDPSYFTDMEWKQYGGSVSEDAE